MLLQEHEREKFVQYLQVQINSLNSVIGQMETMQVTDMLTKAFKLKLGAFKIVLADLLSAETLTIGKL